MHELPLLVFTLLIQGSVGLTIFTAVAAYSSNPVTQKKNLRVGPLLCACIAGGLGLIASTLHLGYPLNAFNALRHVSSSWLSREIVFASLYLGVLGLCTLIVLVKKQLIRGFLPVAALLGLIDVWCMSAIYANTSVITWMHANTWLMFYGSVGIVGAVAQAACMRPKTPAQNRTGFTLARLAAMVVLAVVGVRLLAQPAYMEYLSRASVTEVVTLPHQPVAAFIQLGGVRLVAWAMSLAGAVLFAISGWRNQRNGLVIGSLLLLIAELMFRFIFFSIS